MRAQPIAQRLFLAWALSILVMFAFSVSGDTYSAWKARNFTKEEQADPAISGELALSLAGDGIPNLLKYAFGLDPHVDGWLGMPQGGLVRVTSPSSGELTSYPAITYRQFSADPPSDLYFVPELSLDQLTWTHGESVFAPG